MVASKTMNHGSLFSGIGGFDLASDWMGWNNVFHCEWMPFPQKILKHYWPNAISYHDITKTDFTIHRGTIDILTGGFPCQPYSIAGKRLGKEDERHLWPEMLRAIREIQPTWVLGENVYGLTNWNGGMVFQEVCVDLEAEGYEVQPVLLPASGIGAPHHRMRVWFVAMLTPDTDSGRQPCKKHWKKKSRQFAKTSVFNNWQNFPTQSPICGGDDGLPTELDGIAFSKWKKESIKGYGNAVVPQLVFEIFKVIEQIHNNSMGISPNHSTNS